MAIAFARPEYVSRKKGQNACCKAAYNARSKIKDEQTGITYNFIAKGGNVYHEMLLPEHVDKNFKDPAVLSNEVEKTEKRKDSQLYVEWVLALAKEENVSLELKLEMVHEFIRRKNWIKEGLGVQIDIHEPHENQINWHAHLLVTTRRFTKCGKKFENKKATDLQPEVRFGKVQKTIDIDNNVFWRDVQNDLFKQHGMDNRVDLNGEITQEHLGPVRMRNILNQAAQRNEEKKEANIEYLDSGRRLLDRVTRTQSIFTLKDLEKAVSYIPSSEKRKKLIAEALALPGVINLYESKVGTKQTEDVNSYTETNFFTTNAVREEENRIIRIAERIAGQSNQILGFKMAQNIDSYKGFRDKEISDTQREALKALLLGTGGVRILRGRAGTGKSTLLGALNELATNNGNRIIGLAPTNKAKIELGKNGFAGTETVKGFLYGVRFNRIWLRPRSTIVLDEAGMVGNRDLQELFKCAHSFGCNVILAGDERQLTSVERGGMFEILAERFGSFELDEIRRQKDNWGREMALCFAKGDTSRGIDILKANGGLKVAGDELQSAANLVSDWSKSKEAIDKRLIVTVRNKDAELINEGIRGYLKETGVITGKEYAIESKEIRGNDRVTIKRSFAAGERVLFTSGGKETGVPNGEFGTLLSVAKDEFAIKLDNGKEIKCDPKLLGGLKHGYAVTTYKSQGATISEVYAFHNGAGNCRSTYVGLTRHELEIKLYYNAKTTPTIGRLKDQLGRIDDKTSSLKLFTREDIELQNQDNSQNTLSVRVGKWFGKIRTGIADRLHADSGYYSFEVVKAGAVKVEQVLEQAALEVAKSESEQEMAMAVGAEGMGGVRSTNYTYRQSSGLTPKQKFYAKVDGTKGGNEGKSREVKSGNNIEVAAFGNNKEMNNNIPDKTSYREYRDYEGELEQLKSELRFKTERIVDGLLGNPNKHLSNGTNWRYGKNGSLVVSIKGSKAGTWYDFEEGRGGDLISLVQREKKEDFKGAVEYLKSMAGITKRTNIKLVHNNEAEVKYQTHIADQEKERQKEIREQKRAEELYAKAKPILGRSIASRYLIEHRGIESITGTETKDIKTSGIWDKVTAKRYPAIIAFSRDARGKITGGQTILLDSTSGTKANVATVKKSFGKISGSFVEVQAATGKNTGNINERVNQKNKGGFVVLNDKGNERITFIAEGLETALSIREAKVQGKILCSLGIGNIKNYMPASGERVIICADNDGAGSKTSKTIEEAATALERKGAVVQIVAPEQKGDFNDVLKEKGTRAIKEIINKGIQEFKLSNEIAVLSKDERINLAEEFMKTHAELVEETEYWSGKQDRHAWALTLANLGKVEKIKHLQTVRNSFMEKSIQTDMDKFAEEKAKVKTLEQLKPVIEKEQQFLSEIYERCEEGAGNYSADIGRLINIGKEAKWQPEKLEETFKYAESMIASKIEHEWKLVSLLSKTGLMTISLANMEQKHEYYLRKTVLPDLRQQIGKSKNIEQVLDAIDKEQEFLAGLHSNLKHSSYDKAILAEAKQAHENKQENLVNNLKSVTWQSIDNKIMKEQDIVGLLKSANDIKSVYNTLDKAWEAREIRDKLAQFGKDKETTKNSGEVLKAIKQEQQFLAGLHGNLRHSDHDKELLELIKVAHNNQQKQMLENLGQAVSHISKHEIMNGEELTKLLKTESRPEVACVSLTVRCQDHHFALVEHNLEKISKGHTLESGSNKFSCPMKYLEHEIINPAHAFVDTKRLNKTLEHYQHLEHQKTLSKEQEPGLGL